MCRRLAVLLLTLAVLSGCSRDVPPPRGDDRRDNDNTDIKVRAPDVKIDIKPK